VERRLALKAMFVAGVLVVSLICLFPSLSKEIPAWWSAALPTNKIHLGLDLRGGMQLTLEVEAEKAVESSLETMGDDLKQTLRKKNIWVAYARPEGNRTIVLLLKKPEDFNSAKEILTDRYTTLSIVGTRAVEAGMELRLALAEKEAGQIKKMAVDQALEIIRNRVDQFGVSEPEITPQGEDRIFIQLPGITDTQRAINLIGRTALLEFKLVDDTQDVNKAVEGTVPPGREVVYEIKLDKETGRRVKQPLLLEKRAVLSGRYVTDAKVHIDTRYNEPYVALNFDTQGARLFERITEENVKRRLAIVLDSVVNSAPVIQEKIPGGQARITGNFTMEEARDLAIVLRAGALPAPVKIQEEQVVGPSLGQDSINQGLWSTLVGGVLVTLFMIVYYKLSGVFADIAVLLDVILILAGMAAFKATLTLPGIAGIVLTIGMAVDANVLIYERIREEIRQGKTPRAAVDAGFSKALSAILDSNITTLITALVLFQFGTGPIKGFAVTLSIGLVVNVWTAVYVCRVMFDYLIIKRHIKTVSV
jgi:preprotein translocase subunit SecD